MARTYTLYVQEPSFDGSYTVTDNLNGSPQWTAAPGGSTTPLGSGWSAAGTVTLAAGDLSSTLSFPDLGSATEICLVEQVSGTTYTPTGLVGTETNGDGGLTTFGYNAVGEEISKTDPAPNPSAPSVRPVTTYVDDALGRVTSIFSPLPLGEGQGEGGEGQGEGGSSITSYGYQFYPSGSLTEGQTMVTTSQGQAVNVSNNSATLVNLPQAPGQLRNYTVYVETSSALSSSSDTFHVSDNDDGVQTLNSSGLFSSATPLGANWYEVGTVQLASGDASSMMTVSYTGSVAIAQVALLQQTSADTYDADGNLVAESDALGNSTAYVYNTLGLPAQQPDPSNSAIPLGAVYDKAGNVLTSTDLMGNVTGYQYNDLGQTVVTTQPAPANGQPQPVTTDSFDADGDLLSETDPLGNVTSYSYDPFGDEVSQSLPNPATGAAGGPTTTSTFDLDGDQLSLTDPDGNTTSWSYDCLGDAIGQSEVVALGYNSQGVIKTTATSSYQFDLDGNLTQSIDADGRVIDYAYSGLGQETGETWYPNVADASAGTGSDGGLSFGYDLDGLMTSASNTAASYGYQYDPQGDVTAVNAQIGGLTPNVILSSAYDVNGDRTSLSANIGGTLSATGTVSGGRGDFLNSYTYDSVGDMTGITQTGQTGGNGVAAKNVVLGYNFNGLVTSIDLYASADDEQRGGLGELRLRQRLAVDGPFLRDRGGQQHASGLPLGLRRRRPRE